MKTGKRSLGWLVGLNFTPWIRAYRDGYRSVMLFTYGNFIVLPYWETKLPVSWLCISHDHGLIHYPNTEPTSPYPILIKLSAWLRIHTYKFLNHWFDLTRVWTHGFESHELPNMGDGRSTHLAILSVGNECSNSFSHPIWTSIHYLIYNIFGTLNNYVGEISIA